MSSRRTTLAALRRVRPIALLGVVLATVPARAIPAFARKYETSCQTCHTVFPKLSPFGEAFRRNGYRFPGIDSDAVNEPQVPLGQEPARKAFPAAVWPGALPSTAPLAFGFNGHATLHPDRRSGGARADNGTVFTTRDLVEEANLWAGGSFDDTTTFFAEITASSTHTHTHTLDIEQARVLFNDLLGPAHLVNLTVGRGRANLTSFGAHSSYLVDMLQLSAPVAGLYGATSDTFRLTDSTTGLQAGGVAVGRFDWDVGLSAGPSLDVRPALNVYVHVGTKFGGLSLDGEDPSGTTDVSSPWAERSLTLDAFACHAASRFTSAANTVTQDVAWVVGAAARWQLDSLEVDSGFTFEGHDHAQADNPNAEGPHANGTKVLAHYDEFAFVAWPWLVPVVRVEYLRATPEGSVPSWDLRVVPGVAILLRANLKATVAAQFEAAHGAPSAGWGLAGGLATPTAAQPAVAFENESVLVHLQAAF